MVINFTNIKKMINQLSPQIIERNKRPQHMMLEIQVMGGERQNNVEGKTC
jgi:pyrimidine operon attenuation protein/uracil phosphoribosyltransferase